MVMMEESNMDKGSAMGTKLADTYMSSATMTFHSKPFPTISSMYFHTNCIKRTKSAIKKVTKKGDAKDLSINFENVFKEEMSLLQN
jgi:hypothetical protein